MSPAWGLAAAAVLVLSVASAIANVEVKYSADGLTRADRAQRATAHARAGAAPPVSIQTVSGAPTTRVSGASCRPSPIRLRDLEAARKRNAAGADVGAHAGRAAPTADVLRAVRQMIADSESRQEQELARRISQVLRDVEGARRVDFDRIQRALAEVQGVDGHDDHPAARDRESRAARRAQPK